MPEELGNLSNQAVSYGQAAINPFNQGRFSQPIVMNRGGFAGGFDTSSFDTVGNSRLFFDRRGDMF